MNPDCTYHVVGTQRNDHPQYGLVSVYDPAAIAQQVVGTTAAQTISNKRFTQRVLTVTQSATPAIDSDNADIFLITGLAQPITSMTTNLTGTPNDGDKMEIRITDNGVGQGITWGIGFTSSGNVTLPTTTSANIRLRTYLEWDVASNKWVCVGKA